ncbi:MAG: rod shape-determining protein, partial [Planctomycetota bacterium]|nr:rod shape-determining protein [Planctomycetota bacterium]
MLGKTPDGIEAIRPLKHGVIADFEVTEAMLTYFIQKVHQRRLGVRPRIVIAVPAQITAVEKQAVYHSAERAGARKVYLIEEPRAAGIGAGLPIEEAQASMIVDIGGGTTEIAVMSLAAIVTAKSLRIAGDNYDDAIVSHLKRVHNLHIGELTAERIKFGIGSAAPLDEEITMQVKGQDASTGMPRGCVVTSQEIREALSKPVMAQIQAIRQVLEETKPELAADLVDSGLTLCGGGALLRNLDRVIEENTGLPVQIADEPLNCVGRGTGLFLENLDRYASILESETE